MIEFQNVTKSYDGATVIQGLDLRIERGEFVVLIGASGSGKSTTVKMINRIEDHQDGRIFFDGREIRSFDVRELRLRMGYAIQSVGLFPHWTVERNIATIPRMLGWSSDRIQRRVSELLQLFQLDEARYRGRYPHQLSGGQQQRIGVARALAADPDVLLMDEPFGALDPVTRASLQQEMRRVHRLSGKTIVLVTHDIDEALLLATRIVLLDKGRIAQAATPLELLSAPANDFVADFIGRGDIGIKLLSLRRAGEFARPGSAVAAPAVAGDHSLREAVALMTVHRVDRLNVLDAGQRHAGVLHIQDILGASREPA